MMMPLNDRAARGFADRLANHAAADGLSPIAGRLFATFLLSDRPQSLDALAAALGVSKASVSTEARHLFERGIVERVSVAGDRRDYYELAPDFFAQVIRARVARWPRGRARSLRLDRRHPRRRRSGNRRGARPLGARRPGRQVWFEGAVAS